MNSSDSARSERLLLLSEHPAANDDRHSPPASATRGQGADPGGWDPFEVWCTRVRDPRRQRYAEG